MNVLITGGTGYLGSHTAVTFLENGNNVLLLDNLSSSSFLVVDKIEKLAGKRPLFFEIDIRDYHSLRSLFRDYNIDLVVHFAGLKSVSESILNPSEYFSVNVDGSNCLFTAMSEYAVRKIVFSSSATVYGRPRNIPIDESHELRATNPYGKTKMEVEKKLHDLCSSISGWGAVCLRYFNPVGAHQSGLMGEDPVGMPNNLMPLILEVASGRRKALQVFGNDYPTKDGTGVRDYIHVVDVAEAHLAASQYLGNTTGWSAFNIGVGRGYSVLELIRSFETITSCSVPYKVVSRRLGDQAECVANVNRAKEILGWNARRSIEDMCASAWRWQENRIDKDLNA